MGEKGEGEDDKGGLERRRGIESRWIEDGRGDGITGRKGKGIEAADSSRYMLNPSQHQQKTVMAALCRVGQSMERRGVEGGTKAEWGVSDTRGGGG